MKRWARRLSYLARRPVADHLLVAQVLVLLGVFRLMIIALSFSRLEQLLGERFRESPDEIPAAEQAQVRRVRWAIRAVSSHTPWNSNCFPQALTARLLLRRRNISSTVYLGARFSEENSELKAHAWLRSGSIYVTGGDGSKNHGAIAAFS